MAKSRLLGSWGEAAAAEYLRRHGYEIAACNYRTRLGEIDLIARNKKFLVFVEVKLRRSKEFALAAEAVDLAKQRRIKTTAQLWLQQHEMALQPRFDVIEVYAPEGTSTRRPTINHIEDAFE